MGVFFSSSPEHICRAKVIKMGLVICLDYLMTVGESSKVSFFVG